MRNVKNVNHEIRIAKEDESVIAKRQGELSLQTEEGRNVTLTDALECENLAYNLLSVKKIEEKELKVMFEKGEVYIFKNNISIMKGKLKGNLHQIKLQYEKELANIGDYNEKNQKMLKHRSAYYMLMYQKKSEMINLIRTLEKCIWQDIVTTDIVYGILKRKQLLRHDQLCLIKVKTYPIKRKK